MRKLILFACIIGGFFISCKTEVKTNDTADTFNIDSVKDAIANSATNFEKASATGDTAVFKSLYTSDGCVYPANMPSLCGSANIAAFYNGGFKIGIRKIALTTNEVFGSGDFVSETGNYLIADSSGGIMDKGKYIVIWKKENGSWKMHRDIWNTDGPVTPPASPKK